MNRGSRLPLPFFVLIDRTRHPGGWLNETFSPEAASPAIESNRLALNGFSASEEKDLMLRSVQLWLLTATLAVSGSCLAAQIQPVGYACTPEGCSACNEGCQNGCNDGCNGYGDCYGNCYDCNGRCTPRQTWRDNCMNWTGHCGPIGRAARWGVPGARCLMFCCDTKA